MTDQQREPAEDRDRPPVHPPRRGDDERDGPAFDAPPWARLGGVLQAKLELGEEDDPAEREADQVAASVVSAEDDPVAPDDVPAPRDAPEVQVTAVAVAGAGEEVDPEPVQRSGAPGRAGREPSSDWQERVRSASVGGRPLTAEERAAVERRTGADLRGVRLHEDAAADAAARAIGARAFTVGDDVAIRAGEYRPHTSTGRRLLAHELAHVVQQRGGNRSAGRGAAQAPGVVRRAIQPEDVAGEMVGRQFALSAALTVSGVTLRAATRVTVRSWSNASDSVEVTAPGVSGPFRVAKTLLLPVRAAASGVNPYSAGVPAQAVAVARGERQLADWLATAASYRSPRARALFATERARLERLLVTRRAVLNRKLIQETMYNRFDSTIKAEVDAANSSHGLTGRDALDPNLVKSMLFQESELGTAGQHLEDPPTHPVKTRFNLGQVVDSSGMALLTLMEADHPAIVAARGIGRLRSDLAAAQRELARLRAKRTRTASEDARVATLTTLSGQSWERFIWHYAGFSDAVGDLFGGASPRNLDYDFWIRMAVRWLFEKRRTGMTWAQAIQAYNGSGARARQYRDAVVNRASGAASAAAGGTSFTPGR